jgi:exoribonuclease-2
MACSLTRAGVTWEHAKDDIYYVIPNFVDRGLVVRAGEAMSDLPPAAVAARVEILKSILTLERGLETVSSHMARHVQDIYQRVHALGPEPQSTSNQVQDQDQDQHKWKTITLPQLVAMVGYDTADPRAKPLAVHRHIMNRAEEFVAVPHAFRTLQTFDVRPLAHTKALVQIRDMFRQRSGAFETFKEKAKIILAKHDEIASRSLSDGQSAQDAQAATRLPELADISFTPEEQVILDFMLIAYRKNRCVQSEPYLAMLAMVVHRVLGTALPEVLGDGVINDSVVLRLLVRLGLYAPWESPALIEQEEVTHMPAILSTGQKTQEEAAVERMLAKRDAATKDVTKDKTVSSEVLEPQGPEDIYLSDPHESLRHDFGDMPVYVIDDVGAQELDDGVSVEPVHGEPGSYWVHVHIADPTAILPPTNVFAQRAASMTQSMYFVNGTTSMLPPSLVQATMSLGSQAKHGRPENVLTFSAKISGSGEIMDSQVRVGRVRNVQILKYDDVDAAVGLKYVPSIMPFGGEDVAPQPASNGEPMKTEAVQDLKGILEVANNIRAARMRLPVFQTYTDEGSVELTSPTLPPLPHAHGGSASASSTSVDLSHPQTFAGFPSMAYKITPFNMTSARGMVAELMMLAARVASRFCVERRLPAVRRCASQVLTPSDEVFQQLLALRDEQCYVPHIMAAQLGVILAPAGFSLEPAEHWPMGIPQGEGYLRVTSPLRRYEDLVAHWQIKHALATEAETGRAKPLFHVPEARGIMARIAAGTKAAKRVNTLDRRFWQLLYVRRMMQDSPNAEENARSLGFDRMEGVVATAASRDKGKAGSTTMRAFVPRFGLVASLVGHEPVPIGTRVAMRLKDVELGFNPRMVTVPAA